MKLGLGPDSFTRIFPALAGQVGDDVAVKHLVVVAREIGIGRVSQQRERQV